MLAQLLAGSAGPSWQQALDEAERALGALSQLLECVRLDKIEVVGSEEQLVARAMELLEERQFWAAVVFQPPLNATATALPPHVRYKIRMDIDDVTRTNKIKDRLGDAAPLSIQSLGWGVVRPSPLSACCSTPGFGTRALQLTHSATCATCGVALSTCRTWWSRRWCGCRQALSHGWGSTCSRCPIPATWMMCECCRTPSDPLPWGTGRVLLQGCVPVGGGTCRGGQTDALLRFLRVLNRSLPLFMTLAWIYSVAMIIKGVVHEKEARLKETMRSMGLSSGMLWLSWFLSSFIPFLLSSALLVLILKAGWGVAAGMVWGGFCNSNLPHFAAGRHPALQQPGRHLPLPRHLLGGHHLSVLPHQHLLPPCQPGLSVRWHPLLLSLPALRAVCGMA